MTSEEGSLVFERMTHSDLEEVMLIEKSVFSDPWPGESFASEIKDKDVSLPFVARLRGELVGYFVAWAAADEIHLGNIAVRHEFRGMGLGQQILTFVIDEGYRRGARIITLEVRETNMPAISLYRKNGFGEIAIRKRYYRDTKEDAIVMMLTLETKPGGAKDVVAQED
ncbi:MAG: ribosomal protein S18-alanine N-acetyltransferase [Candidatus Eisenbacteria bacterium]|nr:ribosomal protein S18-alanine N-acetyltransferase [Candidatus Eisenbacteria bacterium]